jgi:hypothetical protein
MTIIKKTLANNKRSWDSQLIYALWEDRVNTKMDIGKTPFQLVYGVGLVLPTQIELPIMKLLQDIASEPNKIKRRINQLVEVQKQRTQVDGKIKEY